jgi:hypothetical protein
MYVLPVSEQGMVPGELPAQAVSPDLGKHGVSVHKHSAAALLYLRDPAQVAEVDVDVALTAKLR